MEFRINCKMTKKIAVIGHIGKGASLLNGQTIKTKNLLDALSLKYSKDEVFVVDTHRRFLFFLLCPFIILNVLRQSKNVIVLPAQNGVRIIFPVLLFLNKFYKRTIHYDVIGGWLPSILSNDKRLLKTMSKVDRLYVETETMYCQLKDLGLDNVVILPNSKRIPRCIPIISASSPKRLCVFSRINRLKGIDDAIAAVNEINNRFGKIVCTLDIYGKVDKGEEEWFESTKKHFGSAIKYCGFVETEQANTIRPYYLLLFPTHYYTEGIPGTIIDAYSAGVPVLASKWESFLDVIEDGITGFGFDFNDYQSFVNKLVYLCQNDDMVNSLKTNCLKKALHFSNENMMKILEDNLS